MKFDPRNRGGGDVRIVASWPREWWCRTGSFSQNLGAYGAAGALTGQQPVDATV